MVDQVGASSASAASGSWVQALALAPEVGSSSGVQASMLPGSGEGSQGSLLPPEVVTPEVEQLSEFEQRKLQKLERKRAQAIRAASLRTSLEQSVDEGRQLLNFVYSPDVVLLRQALVCRVFGPIALSCPIPTLFLHVDPLTQTVDFAHYRRICSRIDRLIDPRFQDCRRQFRSLAKTYSTLGPRTKGAHALRNKFQNTCELIGAVIALDKLPFIWVEHNASWATTAEVEKGADGHFHWTFDVTHGAKSPMPLSDVLALLDAEVSLPASATPAVLGPAPHTLPLPTEIGDTTTDEHFNSPVTKSELYGLLVHLTEKLSSVFWASAPTVVRLMQEMQTASLPLLAVDPDLPRPEADRALELSAWTSVVGDVLPPAAFHASPADRAEAVTAEVEVGERDDEELRSGEDGEEHDMLAALNGEPVPALAPPSLLHAARPQLYDDEPAVRELVVPGEAALHPVPPPALGAAGNCCPGPHRRMPTWSFGPGRFLAALQDWFSPPPPIGPAFLPLPAVAPPALGAAPRVLSTRPVPRAGAPPPLIRGNIFVHEIQSPIAIPGIPTQLLIAGGLHLPVMQALELEEVAYLAELFPEFVVEYTPNFPSPTAFRNAIAQGMLLLANRPMPLHSYPDDIVVGQTPCYVLSVHFPGTLGITHDKFTYERGVDGFVHYSAEGVPTRRIRAMDWLRAGGKDIAGGHLVARTMRWCPKTGLGLYEVFPMPGRAPPPPLHTDRAFYGKVEDVRFITAVGTAMQQSEVGFAPRRWNPFRRAVQLWCQGEWYCADNGSTVWHIPKGPLAMLRLALTNVVRDEDCLKRATNLAKSYLKTLPLTPAQIARMAPGLVALAMSDVEAEIDALAYIADHAHRHEVHKQYITNTRPPWYKTAAPWVCGAVGLALAWKALPYVPKIVGITLKLPTLGRSSMLDALLGSWRAACRWLRWPCEQAFLDMVVWPIAEATRTPGQTLRARRRQIHGLPPMAVHPAWMHAAPLYEEPIKRIVAWALPVMPLVKRPLAGLVFGVAEAAVEWNANRTDDEYDDITLKQVIARRWPTVLMHTVTACVPMLTALAIHATWNVVADLSSWYLAPGAFLWQFRQKTFDVPELFPVTRPVHMTCALIEYPRYRAATRILWDWLKHTAGPCWSLRPLSWSSRWWEPSTKGIPSWIFEAIDWNPSRWWLPDPPRPAPEARALVSSVCGFTWEPHVPRWLLSAMDWNPSHWWTPAKEAVHDGVEHVRSVGSASLVGAFRGVGEALAAIPADFRRVWDNELAALPPTERAIIEFRIQQMFTFDLTRILCLTSAFYEEPFKKWMARKLAASGVSNPQWTAGILFGFMEFVLGMLGGLSFDAALMRHGPCMLAHAVWTCCPLWASIPMHVAWNFLLGTSPKEAVELDAFRSGLASTAILAALAPLIGQAMAPAATSIVAGGAHAITAYCVLRDFGGYFPPPAYSGRLCEYKEMKCPIPQDPPCLPKLGSWLYGIGLMDFPPVCAGQCPHNVHCAVCHRFYQDTPHPNVRVFRGFRQFALGNACTLLGLEEFPELATPMSYEEYARTYPGPRRRQLLLAGERLCDDPFDNVLHLPAEEILAGAGTNLHPTVKKIATLLFVTARTKHDEQVCGRSREEGRLDFGALGSEEVFYEHPRGIVELRSFHNAPAAPAVGEPNGSMIFTKPRLILASKDFLWQLLSGVWIKPLEHKLLDQSRALFDAPDLEEALMERIAAGQRVFVTKGLTPEQRGALTVAMDIVCRRITGEPTEELDADGSNWDSTMKSQHRLVVVEILRHYGVPEWFLQLLMRDTKKSRFSDPWGNYYEGPSAMCSGRTYTAYFHCLINGLITLFCAMHIAQGRPPPVAFVELTLRQVWAWYREGVKPTARAPPVDMPLILVRVDGDDNKCVGGASFIRKLNCQLYVDLHFALGVDMKFQFFRDTYDGDYCSSLSWKCTLRGQPTCVDGPIVGRALQKCGYALTYYGKESKRNAWLRGVFEPCRRDWAHIPVLRAVAERCARVPGRVGKCPMLNNPRKLHVAEPAEADQRTWLQFEARYGLQQAEVVALEQQILAIPSLPARIRHRVIDRIMAVDFPDTR